MIMYDFKVCGKCNHMTSISDNRCPICHSTNLGEDVLYIDE